MDTLDTQIVAALRKDARQSISALADSLKVARGTVQSRIERLEKQGTIAGYTVVLAGQEEGAGVRAITMLTTRGNSAQSVVHKLLAFPFVTAVHSTNGRIDLIAEITTETLEQFDIATNQIKDLAEVESSESNILLSTFKF